MTDRTHIFNPLDDAARAAIRSKSIRDVEAEAREAREALKSVTKHCAEADGVYDFKPAAEALGKSEAEVKEMVASARAYFEYCNSVNLDKTRCQSTKAALETPIVGERDLPHYSVNGHGDDLFRALEHRHGMEPLTKEFILGNKTIDVPSADFREVLWAAAANTTRDGGSANPPTGITPDRPINVLTPYEAIDRRRNVVDMLPSINITGDTFKYRKEIDAGVGNPSGQTGVYPNYNVSETNPAPIQPVGSKEESVPVETLRAMVTMSREQASDVGAAVPYASMLLARQMKDTTEWQTLLGDGTSPNIRGLFNTPGRITTTKTNTTTLFDFWIAVHEKYSKPRGDVTDAAYGSGTYPAQIFFNDAEVRRMQKEKDEDGRYLWGEPSQDALSHVWGTPLYVNDFIPANKALMMNIDPRYVMMVLRSNLTLESSNSNADDFARYQTSMMLHQRLTLAVPKPATINEVAGLNVAKA